MKRKICFVTGSRAEYGLLRRLIIASSHHSSVSLQVIATGSHLSRLHGLTYKEIISDGIKISSKVNLHLKGRSSQDIIHSMSIGLKKFSTAFQELNPDIIVVLGDRYEIFSAATAAMILNIPIAHIHGGETTEGAYDEAIRHSVTKMSHLHFVATKHYKKRVVQMGESPATVFMVGGLGVDAIRNLTLLNQSNLEDSLNFKFRKKNLLICYHPETLISTKQNIKNLLNLLDALKQFKDAGLIFTLPNADTGNSALTKLILAFVSKTKHAKAYTSLGQLRFLSALKCVDAIVGNSSSGLLEAPTFNIGTINIGDRQKGRVAASSVISCEPTKEKIIKSLIKAYSLGFQRSLKDTINPYGRGGASLKILKKLMEFPLERITNKTFYNIK